MPSNCVLKKTLGSPLDCKETPPVHPKGDQSWVFIGKTDVEAETPIFWPPDVELTHLKRPWCWERSRAGREGDDRGCGGWMASLTQWTWVWVNLGVGDGQGGLACCSAWGLNESDSTEQLNWTELNWMLSGNSLLTKHWKVFYVKDPTSLHPNSENSEVCALRISQQNWPSINLLGKWYHCLSYIIKYIP